MSAPVIKQLITLVLACYSLSVMAQSGFIWGYSNWGAAVWGAGATPVPVMPIEGLAALIAIIVLLPVWEKFRTMLRREH